MKRFTVFTVILTIIIVVVAAEMIVNDYLPQFKKDIADEGEDMELDLPSNLELASGQANVLGADVDYNKISDGSGTETEESLEELVYEEFTLDGSGPIERSIDEEIPLVVPTDSVPTYIASESDFTDFEDDNFVSYTTNVYIRDDMIRAAGFSGAYLEEEVHNGFLYKSIYFDDLYDVEVDKYAIRTEDALFAKVYVFKVGGLSGVSEVYEVLKMRASEGLDIEVNESSDYGAQSFFMNDSRRDNVAFLTTRIGSILYGFSYPKDYHSQVKNLITLIDYEF